MSTPFAATPSATSAHARARDDAGTSTPHEPDPRDAGALARLAARPPLALRSGEGSGPPELAPAGDTAGERGALQPFEPALAGAEPGFVVQLDGERALVGRGPLRRASEPDARGPGWLYAPDFYLRDAAPWWTTSASDGVQVQPRATWGALAQQLVHTRQAGPSAAPDSHALPSPLAWTPPAASAFEAHVRALLAAIERGEIAKAIATGASVAAITGLGSNTRARPLELGGRLAATLAQVLAVPAPLRAYGAWGLGPVSSDGVGPHSPASAPSSPAQAGDVEHRGILGATPELLFELRRTREGARIDTIALAGTRPRPAPRRGTLHDGTADDATHTEQLAAELLADAKERHEHELVLDDITAVLGALPGARVDRGATRVIALPTLLHLQTDVRVELPDLPDFAGLARRLHPTPALGVAPRERGLAWLRRHDAVPERGRFGAPFGWRHPDGTGVCFVAIRNVQWTQQLARMVAGCGIVRGSDPAREWAELRAKQGALQRLLDP